MKHKNHLSSYWNIVLPCNPLLKNAELNLLDSIEFHEPYMCYILDFQKYEIQISQRTQVILESYQNKNNIIKSKEDWLLFFHPRHNLKEYLKLRKATYSVINSYSPEDIKYLSLILQTKIKITGNKDVWLKKTYNIILRDETGEILKVLCKMYIIAHNTDIVPYIVNHKTGERFVYNKDYKFEKSNISELDLLERNLLRLEFLGLSSKQITGILNISQSTHSRRKHEILDKLHVNSMIEAYFVFNDRMHKLFT